MVGLVHTAVKLVHEIKCEDKKEDKEEEEEQQEEEEEEGCGKWRCGFCLE